MDDGIIEVDGIELDARDQWCIRALKAGNCSGSPCTNNLFFVKMDDGGYTLQKKDAENGVRYTLSAKGWHFYNKAKVLNALAGNGEVDDE